MIIPDQGLAVRLQPLAPMHRLRYPSPNPNAAPITAPKILFILIFSTSRPVSAIEKMKKRLSDDSGHLKKLSSLLESNKKNIFLPKQNISNIYLLCQQIYFKTKVLRDLEPSKGYFKLLRFH